MSMTEKLPNGFIGLPHKDSEILNKIGVASQFSPGYNTVGINPLCYPGEDLTQEGGYTKWQRKPSESESQ